MADKKLSAQSVPIETQIALKNIQLKKGKSTKLVRIPVKVNAGSSGPGPAGPTGPAGDGLSLYYFYSV
jgi:hypothetical protein